MESESFKIMNQDFVKLDRFDDSNFSRWQDKMKFLLTFLRIAYVLDPALPPIAEDPPAPVPVQPVPVQPVQTEDAVHICNDRSMFKTGACSRLSKKSLDKKCKWETVLKLLLEAKELSNSFSLLGRN